MNMLEEIYSRLSSLSPSVCEVVDESELHTGHVGATGGGHYRLRIVSPVFSGMPTLARHRLVYEALGTLMPHAIHALSITASSSEEASPHN
jgi:BolA family transcriptional regulator, general stress-responsive regulator